MRRRQLFTGLTALTLAAGCTERSTGAGPDRTGAATAAPPSPEFERQVDLPAPTRDGSVSLEAAIARRRSRRSFGAEPLSWQILGQLLWAAQGITGDDGKRAAPSAGALYPLELYVVTEREVMHYSPRDHRLAVRGSADLRPALSVAAVGQQSVARAPDVIVIAAVPDRTRRKYFARAGMFVNLEAGHAAQNILLQATVLDLAAVPIGAFDSARAAEILALPSGRTVQYLIPVGAAA